MAKIKASERRQKQREANIAKAKAASERGNYVEQGSTNQIKEEENAMKSADTQSKSKKNNSTAKTYAKAMGLKSALVFNDKLVLTSFADSKGVDQGNYKSSDIAKISDFEGGKIFLNNERMFKSEITRETISLKSGKESTFVDNPALRNIGMDYIGIKDGLEKEFFGRTFQNDNLHVQLAYNVLDIKKILGTYINNIIYIFYNLNRGRSGLDEQTYDDLVGTLYAYNSYEGQQKHIAQSGRESDKNLFDGVKDLLGNTSAYYTYFGNMFEKINYPPKDGPALPCGDCNYDSQKEIDRKISKNYNVLRVLSLVRQLCVHTQTKKEGKWALSESALFDLEKTLNLQNSELLDILDNSYKKSIENLNDSFVKNSAKNLYVIGKIYPNVSRERITEKYYRLTIRKEELNIGVNIKTLREKMLEKHFPEVLDMEYDLAKDGNSVITYRSKIYTVMNYILYDLFDNDDVLREGMVEELRRNMSGEEGREKIYSAYAGKVWAKVGDKFEKCRAVFVKEKAANFKGGKGEIVSLPRGCKLSAENTDYFAKLLFFVCKFLDGKEINELLCSMINKFDNIADLMDAAGDADNKVVFSNDYKFFERSREISNQIRIVKNLASKGSKKSKKDKGKNGGNFGEQLYFDAVSLFGYDIEKYCRDASGNVITDKNGKPVLSDAYSRFRQQMFEDYILDANGQKQYDYRKKCYKINHQQRNFIANNVLNSKWFFYVVKYNRPENCRKLMANREVLKFVLKDIPETQIKRYYKSVTGGEVQSPEAMRDVLITKLSEFSVKSLLGDLRKMTKDQFADQKATSDKEKMKALVRLYLTAAYLITKSMVKVNTRFSIAFSVLERDYHFTVDARINTDKFEGAEMLAVTEAFIRDDEKIYKQYKAECARIKELADPAARKAAYRKNDEKLRAMHYSIHSYECIKKNMGEAADLRFAEDGVYNKYRNAVVHLNVINVMDRFIPEAKAKSYYGLYCVCLQRYLAGKGQCADAGGYKGLADDNFANFKTFSKNLMWLLNLPFAYNLARYKNLSCEELFNEQDKREAAEQKRAEDKLKNEE